MTNAPLNNEPVYFIPKTSPLIAKYQNIIDLFENDQSLHTLVLDIDPEVVSNLDNGLMSELLAVLQHAPHLLERFTFALDFKFAQITGSELFFQDSDWKSDPAYYRWFCKMGESPVALFFIHDPDARFYALTGDMLADGKFETKVEDGKNTGFVGFEGKELELLCSRLCNACWFFHMYCHGSGYDPQPAIESILADFNLPINYEDIRKQYLDDIQKGIKFRIVKSSDEGDTIL